MERRECGPLSAFSTALPHRSLAGFTHSTSELELEHPMVLSSEGPHSGSGRDSPMKMLSRAMVLIQSEGGLPIFRTNLARDFRIGMSFLVQTNFLLIHTHVW